MLKYLISNHRELAAIKGQLFLPIRNKQKENVLLLVDVKNFVFYHN